MNPQINPCFSIRKLILKLNFNYNLESNFLRLQITDADTNLAASQLVVPTPTPLNILGLLLNACCGIALVQTQWVGPLLN